MAITLPNVFADGFSADPVKVKENIYQPSAAKSALSAVNGWLDADELAAGYKITYAKIRAQELFRPYIVSHRHHLHFKSHLFRSGGSVALKEAYIPVADAGLEFYVPRAALVRFAWGVELATDVEGDDAVWIQFFVEETAKSSTLRRIPGGIDPGITGGWNDQGWRWSVGHWWQPVAEGWTYAGLRVFGDRNTSNPYILRVQRRWFSVIVCRWDEPVQG